MNELKANWGLLLAAAVCSSLVGIHYHFIGPMIKPLSATYGWSRGETSLALTIGSVMLPPVAIAVGWLGDRFGPRRVVLPGVFLYGASFATLGLAGPALWSWYALFFVYSVVGNGAGIVLWSKAIVQNFEESRGLALAIASSGVGILMAIIPTFVLFSLANFGVRGTFFASGAISVIVMLPLAWLFCPRGRGRVKIGSAQYAPKNISVAVTLRHPTFWLLLMAVLTIGVCNGPLQVQMQPILTDSGMTPQLAAKAALIMGPALIVARLGVGFLFDRFPARLVAGACFLAPGIASVLLGQLDGSFALAAPAVIVAAIAMGAEVDVASYLTSRYISQAHFGFAYGAIIGAYGLGLSLGSTAAGYVHDLTGSHTYALVMVTVLSLLSVGLIYLLGPVRRALHNDASLPSMGETGA